MVNAENKVVLHTGERGHGILRTGSISGEAMIRIGRRHNQDGSLSNETFSIDICVISATTVVIFC